MVFVNLFVTPKFIRAVGCYINRLSRINVLPFRKTEMIQFIHKYLDNFFLFESTDNRGGVKEHLMFKLVNMSLEKLQNYKTYFIHLRLSNVVYMD